MKPGLYRRSLIIPFIKLLFDMLSLELAIAFSYWLRFYSPLTNVIPVTKGIPGFTLYINFSLLLIVGYIVLFISFSSYRSRRFTTFAQDIPIILKVCLLGILLTMSAAFLYRGFSFSRLVIALYFFNTLIFLILFRFLFHKIKKVLIRKDYSVLRIVLACSADRLDQTIDKLSQSRQQTFNILGYYTSEAAAESSYPYMGSIEQIGTCLERSDLDGVVMAFNQYDYHKILNIIRASEGRNIELYYMPEILDLLTANVNVIDTDRFLLLQLKKVSLTGWQGFIKSVFDFSLAVFTLIGLSPLIGLMAIIIKMTSPGPVFYRQKRVGLDGYEFEIYKFRSMTVNAEEASGPVWAQKDDPRTTRIGKILRRTSLDELPQLINVIKGDMSIVGPRPERPHFVQKFKSYIPQYSERHRVRSGITGWAQVNGLRGQSPIEERTRYDVFYIENWSLWLDIKIIIMTFLAIIKGENAY